MAESIVKIPRFAGDDDFLAFSFDGKNSHEDFGLWRTSDGGRYNDNLTPQMNDKTAEIPGGDGMYYFSTTYKQKDFPINFAFDGLTDKQIRELKIWLSGKKMGELWFSEAPYKVYMVKVTNQPNLKTICFNDENGHRVYKGEGSVQFTAYWPYAHTPDRIVEWSDVDEEYVEVGSGKDFVSYAKFTTAPQWQATSGLIEEPGKLCIGENPGDIPAHFTLTIEEDEHPLPIGTKIVVGGTEIITAGETYGLTWDSKTGLLYGKIQDNGEKVDRLVAYNGNGLCEIPVGESCDIYYETTTKDENEKTIVTKYDISGKFTTTIDGEPSTGRHNTLSLNYHYWYY